MKNTDGCQIWDNFLGFLSQDWNKEIYGSLQRDGSILSLWTKVAKDTIEEEKRFQS